MKIKPGVKVLGLRPELLLAVIAAERIWAHYNAEVVITSGTEHDGGHRHKSAHWSGRAVDLRVKNLAHANRPRAAELLAEALGLDYDVLHEGIDEPWEHVHVEYDPHGEEHAP